MIKCVGNIPEDLLLGLNALDLKPVPALISAGSSFFLEVHEAIGSTNARAKVLLEALLPEQHCAGFKGLVCADSQTAGRGRLQRQWWSPAGQNSYTSFGFLHPSEEALDGLSLAVGLAVRSTIVQTTGLQNIAVKWPNDVYASGVKIAGILIEAFQMHGFWHIVIGIGVNVNQIKLEPGVEIGQPWTSLALQTEAQVDRGDFMACLTREIQRCFHQFQSLGWSGFASQWLEADWLYGRQVLVQGQSELRGKAIGVDQQGLLQVRDTSGHIHKILSGEVSVRACLS